MALQPIKIILRTNILTPSSSHDAYQQRCPSTQKELHKKRIIYLYVTHSTKLPFRYDKQSDENKKLQHIFLFHNKKEFKGYVNIPRLPHNLHDNLILQCFVMHQQPSAHLHLYIPQLKPVFQ